MTHHMKLAPAPFDLIGSGKKTIEMRLCDEKRQKIQIGDEVEFENTLTHQKIKCIVTKLTRYKDFFELFSDNNKIAIGYGASETANAEDMFAYYSPEQIKKYGTLAIEIKLI